VCAVRESPNVLVRLVSNRFDPRSLLGAAGIDFDHFTRFGVLDGQQADRGQLPIETIADANRDDIVAERERPQLGSCLFEAGVSQQKVGQDDDHGAPIEVLTNETERERQVRSASFRFEAH
jgi:hypothetical protein